MTYEEEYDGDYAKHCAFCGEEFGVGEECIYYMEGVNRIGPKSGRRFVEVNGYDPADPAVLHKHCIELFLRIDVKAGDEEEELLKFCAGCGSKLSGL